MRLDLGRWRSMQGYGPFAHEGEAPLFVQFSGGRTSGLMAAMAPDSATIAFENTGREHPGTLEFIQRVEDALGQEIVWLEFRPPEREGDPPRTFRYERVTFNTASRRGEPFAAMMQAINAYRRAKGESPVAPWARGRICTTHLKHRVLDHYVRDLGFQAHDRFIGLRADEPERVAQLRKQESRDKGLLVPLFSAGITKPHVLEFWSRQPFDLKIEEYEGNCDGCFLKDYADISRAIGGQDAAEWWSAMQDAYPRFGGERLPRYADLAQELPMRLAVESSLRAGEAPINNDCIEPRRFRLLVRQEERRLQAGPTPFHCACEAEEEP